ncbi:hypothetical protein ASPZODRAFT_145747 [Penicilliopsis zonata CBS 506.65]|uniref:Pumilio homology domain family member 3 n=1 Tax=Penicilliopsis zonata CBS 506.65 TaxID=1073090 RepID=A0A1L9S9H8_9EURO|nr:hypothetical protein ASPZODRAFT_145747 [Penicilliopsis zonata CBS 506.65]OJJ43807.1 hypothetical protein ASPZODRAFT_145747 [Penicilliopsis zonata CBS 506.65]
MAANASAVHSVRSNRPSNIGPSGMNSERTRASHHTGVGKSFGGAKGGWNSNIWGDSSLGNGFAEGRGMPLERSLDGEGVTNRWNLEQHISPENAFEGKSGSGSLLPSSESDAWSGRPTMPWNTVSSTSSSLSMGHGKGMTTSPVQSRPSDRSAPALTEAGDTTSYFALPRSSGIGTSAGIVSHKTYLNSATDAISPSTDSISFGSFGGFKNADGRRQISSSAFATSPVGTGFPTKAGFPTSLDGQRSEEIVGTMGMSSLSQTVPDTFANPAGRTPYTHLSHNSASYAAQRPVHSSHPSFHSESQGFEGRYSNGQVDINAGLTRLQLSDGGYVSQQISQRPSYLPSSSFEGSLNRLKFQGAAEESNYQAVPGYANDAASELQLAYAASKSRVGDSTPISPSEYSRMGSPFYTTVDNPSVPTTQLRNGATGRYPETQSATLDRKLRAIQPDDYSQVSANSAHRLQFPPAYDFAGYQAARLNALSGFYPMSHLGGLSPATMVARGHRDHDSSQIVRSPLLEEFRANSKGNKRYELKDIYNHVVEFSGDQHGSRFIQQKLETANSDEKEQVFREIQPNCLQLMTDVFGNYVVQKLFEHGNQSQKKLLANQMKGHVLALSTQMYGCRVVQKALEHILTDQQAMMVKELENHVLKCVRDQNGNHVIQKAIERVPSQYVQFIINAFKGQVSRLAAHPYGCRVIQRMLEHCEEVDRESILAELHACTPNLIPDQFGNYVIQHVIENGEEKDRSVMVNVVISQLLVYSKHKFASNVVEKSIEFGETNQRRHIIQMLTLPNERGESPLLGLMRDQYGNYVIQKVLGQLKGAEREALIDQIKPMLSQLKKFSYGKQIVAIEKLIFDPNSPMSAPPAGAISSTTPPNSHKSSPQPSRRSLTGLDHCRGPLVGAAPPTPPPTDSQSAVEGSVEPKGLADTTVTPVPDPEAASTGAVVSVSAANSSA